MKRFAIIVAVFVFSLQGMMTPCFGQSSASGSFEGWLERYGAWDRLEREYATESDDSPEVILKRAEVYLNLNTPSKTLEIIEMTPAFASNATESDRLWLGGRAHRAMGDLTKAVLWFSQSAAIAPDKGASTRRFKTEPGLESVWMDVWLKRFWTYRANFTLARDAQRDTLRRIQEIGSEVWGGSYWTSAAAALSASDQPGLSAPDTGADTPNAQPVVSTADTDAVATALALASLEKFDDARVAVATVSRDEVRAFWRMLIDFLESGDLPSDIALFDESNSLKARAFWEGNMLAHFSVSRSGWLLGNPESGPWTSFRNNILSMPLPEANQAIENELGSLLISEQTATLLSSFKFALALASGDFLSSATSWNKTNKQRLPLALQLAGALRFKESLNNLLPDNQAEALNLHPILSALCSAGGYDIASDEAPFWVSAPKDRIKTLSQRWPMDKLLLLASWQQEFTRSPSAELARRSAYLFDDTAFGIESTLYLADQSVRANQLQLGAFYLNTLKPAALPPIQRMQWYDVRLRLELESGREDAALETFRQMSASGGPVPVMTRLRMALLYQQKRDFETAREHLLKLWDTPGLTTTLQAETLFWLGEGEQAMRNTEKALDYYLRLAWQYPQENIWALTAMYRASLIYERQGNYDTAKRLLTTVVSRADRKEQREAAKARIDAIDKKMGQTKTTDTLVYPF
ncbi:tetratricopeptide repeat protein [Pseudodesulfovibrio sp. F-1]|uniref:Tetratricopeptide repeat protein n=1 Tax=Pseudodesulfovibrio alkaliphilus TaxID=2661613 RepID=A0A7K1KQA4_9BACT|nr:tetratricopeptide repeat protein [Pseudodesulfovibrio alkaliphilus]MUM78267.1 tetratricopeptide repeat protein [Pseudodesulfovibrio alkaliphilus]